MIFFGHQWIFFKSFFFFKKIFLKYKVSNSLDPDQARHFVGPDVGPNCLQRCADDKSSNAGKELIGDFFSMR